LRRLEAEPIRDALLAVAGKLDLTVGGKSFEDAKGDGNCHRRAAYMSRGYLAFTNAMPDYLQTFDAEDGRMACPRRNQTVTAPQGNRHGSASGPLPAREGLGVGSWSQCMRKRERRLSTNAPSPCPLPPPKAGERGRLGFMVPMHAQKRREALHEPQCRAGVSP